MENFPNELSQFISEKLKTETEQDLVYTLEQMRELVDMYIEDIKKGTLELNNLIK